MENFCHCPVVPGRRRMMHLAAAVLTVLLPLSAARTASAELPALPRAEANDNRRAGGVLEGRTLTLALRAAPALWQPEGPAGPALRIEAFGEVGRPLSVPAPLIRVPEDTGIVVSIANELTAPLVVHGLCTRGGKTCPPIEVPAGETRTVRFAAGPPGTYHYWASSIGAPVPFRELAGAFVVDPAAGPPEPDRILVITEWSDLTAAQLREIFSADVPTEAFVRIAPRLTFVINGLSWPATERLSYETGERVRWRVVNLTSQPHPLHLHGFYFDVDSLGDGLRDTVFGEGTRRRVVTQLLQPGATLTMTWTPERAGNWLFHCHIMHHVSPDRSLGGTAPHNAHHDPAPSDGAGGTFGMAGMVMGVVVRDPGGAAGTMPAGATPQPRRLTLTMQAAEGGTPDLPASGFVLQERGEPIPRVAAAPGPVIVLRRDEPVEITLVNRLAEPTAIHWHGMELDSYYDGVHGWSGAGRRVTPMIDPGGTFVVRFTPPRAGTFIYHTHLHDYRQLSSGLYGPLVVIDPGERFDPATDHVVVLGRGALASAERSLLTDPDSVVINGQRRARLAWKAGGIQRVRLINITADDVFAVTLQAGGELLSWRPIAKDGAPLPPGVSVAVPARQTIAVGETYDFELTAPSRPSTVWLEVRTPGGKWQAQGQVIVR